MSVMEDVVGRYREIRTKTQLEKLFPYVVELAAPPFGFGTKINLIEAWIATKVQRSQFACWTKNVDGRDIVLWGFNEASTAQEFDRFLRWTHSLTDDQIILAKKMRFS